MSLLVFRYQDHRMCVPIHLIKKNDFYVLMTSICIKKNKMNPARIVVKVEDWVKA